MTEQGLVKVSLADAKQLAKDSGKVLKHINYHEGLPLYKVLTFQESRPSKKQIRNEKHLRIPLGIDIHDLAHKFNQAEKYLEAKLSVKFNLFTKKRRRGEDLRPKRMRIMEAIQEHFPDRKVMLKDNVIILSSS